MLATQLTGCIMISWGHTEGLVKCCQWSDNMNRESMFTASCSSVNSPSSYEKCYVKYLQISSCHGEKDSSPFIYVYIILAFDCPWHECLKHKDGTHLGTLCEHMETTAPVNPTSLLDVSREQKHMHPAMGQGSCNAPSAHKQSKSLYFSYYYGQVPFSLKCILSFTLAN